MHAELRARIEDLRRSRSRIVEAGDRARRRLERDLHDGAQQRLVALAIGLRVARGKVADDPAAASALLDEATDELGRISGELRELARGIHPPVLAERGLGAALETLARRTPVPVDLVGAPCSRLPERVESAAYFLVAEALTNVARYAGATGAEVSTVCDGRTLDVQVRDDGVGGAKPEAGSGLRGLADRVAALDGSFEVVSPPGQGTVRAGTDPVRVVVGDDSVLLREGVVRLLAEAGMEVVGQAGDAEELLRKTRAHRPDVAVVDIRMPPTHTDDGLRAALLIRSELPDTGVLVLSQYMEDAYAFELFGRDASGIGYLLKDRVADVERFTDAVRRVAAGGSALDPEVVARLVGRHRRDDPLGSLTGREREVLELMAEGRSNRAIAEGLVITERAVEKHVTSIFEKLGLAPAPEDHRRVLAVLTYLRA